MIVKNITIKKIKKGVDKQRNVWYYKFRCRKRENKTDKRAADTEPWKLDNQTTLKIHENKNEISGDNQENRKIRIERPRMIPEGIKKKRSEIMPAQGDLQKINSVQEKTII